MRTLFVSLLVLATCFSAEARTKKKKTSKKTKVTKVAKKKTVKKNKETNKETPAQKKARLEKEKREREAKAKKLAKLKADKIKKEKEEKARKEALKKLAEKRKKERELKKNKLKSLGKFDISDIALKALVFNSVVQCATPVGTHCFMGVRIEENDEGIFTSDLEEARSDAADIMENCVDGEGIFSLNELVSCINNDVREGYELTVRDFCQNERYEELHDEIYSSRNGYLLNTCREIERRDFDYREVEEQSSNAY